MGSGREMVKYEARRKGWRAALMGISTVAITAVVVPASIPLAALFGLGGGVLTAARTFDWLKYRGTWGLKF